MNEEELRQWREEWWKAEQEYKRKKPMIEAYLKDATCISCGSKGDGEYEGGLRHFRNDKDAMWSLCKKHKKGWFKNKK